MHRLWQRPGGPQRDGRRRSRGQAVVGPHVVLQSMSSAGPHPFENHHGMEALAPRDKRGDEPDEEGGKPCGGRSARACTRFRCRGIGGGACRRRPKAGPSAVLPSAVAPPLLRDNALCSAFTLSSSGGPPLPAVASDAAATVCMPKQSPRACREGSHPAQYATHREHPPLQPHHPPQYTMTSDTASASRNGSASNPRSCNVVLSSGSGVCM